MKKTMLWLFPFFVLLVSTNKSTAQTKSETVKEEKMAIEDFIEIANYYKAHPLPVVRHRPMEEGEELSKDIIEPESLTRRLQHETTVGGPLSPHLALLPVSSSPVDTFLAKVSDGSCVPPDTHGGVDSMYCVTAINSSVTIQNRYTHAVISSVTLDGFWASVLPSSTSSFDPRVVYDPYKKRWIMIAVAVNQTSMTNSRILIAMSATGNPTGTWYKFATVTDATNATWLDFPNLGFNKRWVTVTGNYFTPGGSSTNSVLFVYNKALLLSGTSATATKISLTGSGGFTLCPATTYDSNVANMFVIDVSNRSSGKLRLRKITMVGTTPTLSSTIANPTFTAWQGAGAGGADFGPQLGTTYKLQTNDDRITNLTYRNGKLWCAHNAFFPATGTVTRCSTMWWQIDTNGTPNQHGLVTDPTNSKFYAFPSITVNKNNDALVGFAYMSAAVHPSCGYALHMHTDPNDTMRPAFVYRHGQATYHPTGFGTDTRWGDYSGTCVDPINDLDFWTIQESVPSSPSNRWDTWWAHVVVCATPNTPVNDVTPVLCAGTSGIFSVLPVTGATSYTWTVTGTGWSGFGSTESVMLTAGTGVATITVTANNVCGPGTPLVFLDTPATIPPIPAIATVTPACIGAPIAVYTASATFATSYTWTVLGASWSGASSTSSLTVSVGTGSGMIICSASNGCGTSGDDTIIVTPLAIPDSASAILLTSPLFCSGSTTIFTTPAIAGASSYTWTVSGTGWSGTSTTDSITCTVGTGTGTITVAGTNPCGSGVSVSFPAYPIITPTSTFTITNHTIGISAHDTINFTGTTPCPGCTYTWNFSGGSATPGTGSGAQDVYWTAPGTYVVTLTVDNGGCSSTYSDSVVVMPPVDMPEAKDARQKVTIVPNPSNGTFNIVFGTEVNKQVIVKLIDMQGKTVYKEQFNSTAGNQISISAYNLSQGNYLASINIDGVVINKLLEISK